MVAAVESMAYLGETPWHGLGHALTEAVNVDEMTKLAGLDWTVSQRPTFHQVGDDFVQIKGTQAIVRDTDNKVLGTSSEFWKPFQNRDLMEFFREYVEQGSATLETAGSLNDGKIIWALANINKGFTLNGNDQVNGYILLSNTHKPGAAIRVMTTMVRVVCQNTLTLAHEKGSDMYRQSHMKDFDVSAAKETISLAREQVALHEQEAKVLSDLKLSAHDAVKTLASIFQPEMAKSDFDIKILLANPAAQNQVLSDVLWSVAKAPGAQPGNGWGLLNGYTHYADHVAGKTGETRMNSATFGRNASKKLELRKALLEMADYDLVAA